MNQKTFKIVVSICLIITLIGINFFAVGKNIAIAIYENLESQPIQISNTNIEFDTYFKEGETKTHSKTMSISNGDNLYINLRINNTGVLNDAKITINDPNFQIANTIENQYIKSIEGNSINLNQIVYGNNIEIEIPIKFQKQEQMNLNYFNKETSISLEGEYKDQDENSRNVKGEITIAGIWVDEPQVTLTQEIEKYFTLTSGKNLLQQKIEIEVMNNVLPIRNEQITVQAPAIESEIPEIVAIINNGTKLEESQYSYNKETGLLTITKNNEANSQNIINWGTGKDTYKVIYNYTSENVSSQEATLSTNAQVNIYTIEQPIQLQEQKQEALEVKGNSVSISSDIQEELLYKGYMYANSERETTYTEKIELEISDINEITQINLSSKNSNFVTQDGNEITTNNSVYTKQTKINKEKMIELFGEDVEIEVLINGQDLYQTINKDTETDDQGNIVISYDTESTITLRFSNPIKEGTLELTQQKAIKGNTGYDKQTLKAVTELADYYECQTDLGSEESRQTVKLEDTITDAKVEINTTSLSALQKNENVQIVITLLRGNNRYDLYTNPTIRVKMPEELQEIEVKSIQKLMADELEFDTVRWLKEEKVIEIKMKGTQTQFANDTSTGDQIIIQADITLDKTTPTKASQIIVTYTNENGSQESYEKNIDMQLNSKSGILMYNKISGYNEAGETQETIDEEIPNASLDVNSPARTVSQEVAIVNNYQDQINEVVVTGKIPTKTEETINGQELIGTIDTQLSNVIEVSNPEAKVSYSAEDNATPDSQTWTDNPEGAKSYKIELQGQTIEAGEKLSFDVNYQIPENIEKDASAYQKVSLQYSTNGSNQQMVSAISLTANQTANTQTGEGVENTENIEGTEGENTQTEGNLNIRMTAKTGDKEIYDGDELLEGQAVHYDITLTNNFDRELQGIKLLAKQTNANFYDQVAEYNEYQDETFYYTREVEGLTEKELTIESIPAGETVTVSYEFAITKVEDENSVTSGSITISGDSLVEKTIDTYENPIKQANLKVYLTSPDIDSTTLPSNGVAYYTANIENISNETKNNIDVQIHMPEIFELEEELYTQSDSRIALVEIDQRNNIATFRISSINSQERIIINLGFDISAITQQQEETSIYFTATAENDENSYISNVWTKTVISRYNNVTIQQIGSKEEQIVENGERITYTATIKNEGPGNETIHIVDELPDGVELRNLSIRYNGNEQQLYEEENIVGEFEGTITQYMIQISHELNVGDELVIIAEVEVIGGAIENQQEISNIFMVEGNLVSTQSNEITYVYREETIDYDDDEEIYESDDMVHSLSGTVWEDTNKNGIHEATEGTISGINVYLLDYETGEIIARTTTAEDGSYQFAELESKQYIVIFGYNTTTYRITEYKKSGISEQANSDIINQEMTVDGNIGTYGITDTITITDSDITNIDAGLIQNERFDLSLAKYVSRVTVQNQEGVTTREFSQEQLAKVEITGRYLNGSTVIVEYQIVLRNEGELAGYVTDIIDYIPSDLRFSSELNKDWYEGSDGRLHNTALSNERLDPGQERIVNLILIKTMTNDNTGIVVNTAEINNNSNELGIADIDSTPGNYNQGEDDISTAELIISVRTGAEVTISIFIIGGALIILGIVIFVIRRKEGNHE